MIIDYDDVMMTSTDDLGRVICEQQRVFNVSERASLGQIIGYINGTSSDGIKANFYIVYTDNSGETEKIF
ncbi:unnamed protein product [Wuchereria bancrofti]|uniref:Uncharacterized protein n=1 Tax=Wuchereria bancrofti TaxID=6293 RepID=A0A3P7EQC3_WUCBA|nr:unnamed protein product [Wuchereria bancrofti]